MRRAILLTLMGPALVFAGCTDNEFSGNDRSAAFAEHHAPADVAPARQALREADIAHVKPETMSEAEVAKVVDPDAACRFAFTAAGFPVVAVGASSEGAPAVGVLKLNGKLVELRSAAPAGRSALEDGATLNADGVRAVVAPAEPEAEKVPEGARREAEFLLFLGSQTEIGFRGYYTCPLAEP